MPTLHESVSYPIFEAFSEGLPVASSSVTSLPEQCGDAAVLFDPLDVPSIASAIRTLALDAVLRSQLSLAGKRRAQHFWIERTARAYRALYRQVAGRALSQQDQTLLG